MAYAVWRACYDDAEDAARAAFDFAAHRWQQQERLREILIFAASWIESGRPLDGLAEQMRVSAKEYEVPNVI